MMHLSLRSRLFQVSSPAPACAIAFVLAGCGGGAAATRTAPAPSQATLPSPATSARAPVSSAPPREAPPPSTASKESPFPPVARTTLANGLQVATVAAHALPIVQLRVFVRAGMNYGAPAVAEITGRLLKDGGTRSMSSEKLLDRVETMGASLSVDVGLDGTTIGTSVTKDQLKEALGILGEIVQAPRFDEEELKKLKDREIDDAQSRARADGAWMATRVLLHALYPTGPYSEYEALPSQIAKVNGASVRDFHRRFYVPKNVTVVLAGDVDAAATTAMVDSVFGGWKGPPAPEIDFPAPSSVATANRHVIIADRPKSVQSDIFVVSLAPARAALEFPALRVAIQILGGGPASRLFQDVREARSLAYTARASLIELAHGPEPLIAYAGTQTPKTALAVQGILENLNKLANGPIAPAESDAARRFLSDIFAVRMETLQSIADLVVTQTALGLPDGYWDHYRAAVRAVDPAAAAAEAKALYHSDRVVIVVTGDADVIAPELARFGDVTVVDPEHEFQAKPARAAR